MHDRLVKSNRIDRESDRLPAPVDTDKKVRVAASGGATGPADGLAHKQDVLLVMERRELVRGCLTSWLSGSCSEFETFAISDIESSGGDDRLAHVAAALVWLNGVEALDEWSNRQIESLHAMNPNLPIIVIAEADDISALENLVGRLGVQGFIPTSSSVKVAAAALRLVMAGGRYFPAVQGRSRLTVQEAIDPVQRTTEGKSYTKLTPRENAVLNVLALGAQNKIIAYRLGMSLSTVKAHVHSIIRKLNVRNRTEVVVVARALQVRTSRVNGNTLFGAVAQSAAAASVAGSEPGYRPEHEDRPALRS